MKQECLTYLKATGKSKTLVATLSDTEVETESNDSDEGILNAFTATVDPPERITEFIDEEEDLVELNLERWMNRMTSIQPMNNNTRFWKSMRSCIGWSPRS